MNKISNACRCIIECCVTHLYYSIFFGSISPSLYSLRCDKETEMVKMLSIYVYCVLGSDERPLLYVPFPLVPFFRVYGGMQFEFSNNVDGHGKNCIFGIHLRGAMHIATSRRYTINNVDSMIMSHRPYRIHNTHIMQYNTYIYIYISRRG